MQTIDFLPNRYRERTALRRVKAWQAAVVCLYGFAIIAAIIGQRWVASNLQQRVDAIEFEYAAATANEQMLRDLQLQLNKMRASANLFAYLQHRWPRTQILQAVTSVQPDSVSLRELTISTGGEDGIGGRRLRTVMRTEDTEEKTTLPPLDDLKALRTADQASPLHVHLTGETSNTAELHQFVADLTRPDILAKAELVSLDSVADPRRNDLFEFTIRVQVRSSYDSPPTRVSQRDVNGAQP